MTMATGPRGDNGLAGIRSDSRFLAFVAHFNVDRDYFECHEVMEELWLEEGRHPLLQGLLQAAVGLYHWDNANFSGAVKLMQAALAKLELYEDELLGLDVGALRRDLVRSLEELAGEPPIPFHPFSLVIDSELEQEAVRWKNADASS